MARSKGKRGRPNKLLDESRIGVSNRTSNSRNKRKKRAKPDQEAKVRTAEDITAESQIGAEAQNPDGDTARRPKRGRHKGYDKGRKPDNGAKGEDRALRRSASELGIEWIGSFCPDGQPHFLIGRHSFDGGTIFNCSLCHKNIWLPTYITDAAELDQLIDVYGAQKGYCKFLDKHREAKVMMAKLQDLQRAQQDIKHDEFVLLVIKTMEDKEYDKLEV